MPKTTRSSPRQGRKKLRRANGLLDGVFPRLVNSIARNEQESFPVLDALFAVEELTSSRSIGLPLQAVRNFSLSNGGASFTLPYEQYEEIPGAKAVFWGFLSTEFSDNRSTRSRINSLSKQEIRFLKKVVIIFSRRDFVRALKATHFALFETGKRRKKGEAGDEEPDVYYIEHLIIAVLLAIACGADFLTLLVVLMHDNMEEAKHFWDLDRVAMWLGPLCQAVDAMTKDPQRSSLLTVDKKKSAQREALVYLFDKWPQVGRFGLQCSFFNQLSILLNIESSLNAILILEDLGLRTTGHSCFRNGFKRFMKHVVTILGRILIFPTQSWKN